MAQPVHFCLAPRATQGLADQIFDCDEVVDRIFVNVRWLNTEPHSRFSMVLVSTSVASVSPPEPITASLNRGARGKYLATVVDEWAYEAASRTFVDSRLLAGADLRQRSFRRSPSIRKAHLH